MEFEQNLLKILELKKKFIWKVIKLNFGKIQKIF